MLPKLIIFDFDGTLADILPIQSQYISKRLKHSVLTLGQMPNVRLP